MSFANKPTRPDSKDTAKLRAEYEAKARQFRETNDPASKAKLKDEKQKAFQRVVEQQVGERRENLKDVQKVFARMGKFKTDDQIKEEKAKFEAARVANTTRESRV